MFVRRIEINFPELVEIKNDEQQYVDEMLAFICKRWTREHPGRLMWIAGVGFKMLRHPIACDDDHPMMFDEECLAFDGFEREDYDWLCAECGHKQGDHESCIVDGFKCEFRPAPAKPRKRPSLLRLFRRKVRRVWEAMIT